MIQKIQTAWRRALTEMLGTGLLPAIAAVVGILGIAASCNKANDIEVAEVTTVGISIRMTSTGTGTGYQVGTDYENYVDIDGRDYRIYFFTNNGGNDTFIAQFDPLYFITDDEQLFTTYSVYGEVPDEMIRRGAFKAVVLANWGDYPTPTASTTIDDICAYGTFSHMENFVLGADNLIPMYGVQEYSGITFRPGMATILDEPVNLVRAMAKVEVVLDNSDMVFDSVVLHRYNDKGYCAPSGVYESDDYAVYSGGWLYVNDTIDPHLVNDANDSDQTGRALEMQFAPDNGGRNTWYCYVPEYDNTSAANVEYAWIQVNLSGYEQDLADYRIYFRNYTDGSALSGADYDIGRNVLYRFTVTLNDVWLSVHVDKWEDSFHNDFVFGEDDD